MVSFNYVNIDPSKRGKPCYSTFLAMAMDMEKDTRCEQSIYFLFFISELADLEEGKEVELRGLDGILRWYYIQVHVLQFLFDTKAIEKRLHLQCSGSKQCTLCQMKGEYVDSAGAPVYDTHRD